MEGGDFVARVRAGDRETLEAVIHAYLGQILRAARGAGLSPERAEDVTQATFATFIEVARHHGHVDAVLSAMRQLGFEKLVGSRHSPERDLVVAMVVARILEPQSKLATSLWWHTTTLPEILGVSDAREDDLYAAMDWVLKRQEVIEKKLAARHLQNDGLALYDLTSSYFEGVSCPIARLGYDRDGKKGKLQINYGLLTNERGIPVSVSVFEGNTGDPKTLLPQVEKVQERFGIEQFVMVGDRGMITQTQIDELREMDGVDWITALRPEPIRKLINDGVLQMGLFDERNLFEVTHPDFPNERLVACRNPELAERRRHKRRALLGGLAETLRESEVDHAASGLGAAWLINRFAGFRLVTFYTREQPSAALLDRLSFREEGRGANVWLVVPNDDGVFHGASQQAGVRCVHPVQNLP